MMQGLGCPLGEELGFLDVSGGKESHVLKVG
jgi:hypothetical protein